MKTQTDIFYLWEKSGYDVYVVGEQCGKIGTKLIALQKQGMTLQEAIEELYVRESERVRLYHKYNIIFDDDIMYMYPDKINVIQLQNLTYNNHE